MTCSDVEICHKHSLGRGGWGGGHFEWDISELKTAVVQLIQVNWTSHLEFPNQAHYPSLTAPPPVFGQSSLTQPAHSNATQAYALRQMLSINHQSRGHGETPNRCRWSIKLNSVWAKSILLLHTTPNKNIFLSKPLQTQQCSAEPVVYLCLPFLVYISHILNEPHFLRNVSPRQWREANGSHLEQEKYSYKE